MKTIICDICKMNEGKTLPLNIDVKKDRVGKTEYHYDYIDICLSCLIEKLRDFLGSQSLETSQKFLQSLKGAARKIPLIS